MVAWLRCDLEATAASAGRRGAGADRPAARRLRRPRRPSPTRPPCSRPVAGANTTPSFGAPFSISADVDRIIVAAAHELLGAVERIDQEIGVVVRGDAAGRDFLLGDHRNARRRSGQRREDDQLGRSVGFGHRRAVAFGFDLEAAPDDRRGSPRRLRARPRPGRRPAAKCRSSTRSHPDPAVEPHRSGVHVEVFDHEAGQPGIFLGAARGAWGTAPAPRAHPARWAASSPPSAS